MKKELILLTFVPVIVFIGIFFIISYSSRNPEKEKSPTKIRVVTTIFPLYDFAKNIGGDKAEVSLLLPPGVEAHFFEPKPSDIVNIEKADVFIFTNKYMEPWVEDLLKGITNKSLFVVNASENIKLIPSAGSIDPHVWLDLGNDRLIINSITGAFVEKDPNNKSFYEERAQEYNEKLANLDQEYQSTLATCKTKDIIYAGHYAFGYMAKRYGLKYLAAQGISPDSEPTANDLVNLVNQIKKDNIKYVFYEEFTSPKIAETLANETQTKTLLLNSAHNVSRTDLENGISLMTIFINNLADLKVGLQCL